MRDVLFVAMEAGAAAYLAPLWRRWIAAGYGQRIFALLGPGARRHFPVLGVNGLASSPIEPTAEDSLDRAMPPGFAPNVIVSSATGARVEAGFIAHARRRRLPTLQIIDTWVNYRRRFTGLDFDNLPDRIAVIDDRAADEAVAEGIPAERIDPIGQPAWEETRKLPPAQRNHVMFVGQPIAARFGNTLGYTEADAFDTVRKAASRRPDLIAALCYARHPDEVDLQPEAIAPDRLVMDGGRELAVCGTVLGMSSSLMVDALLAGRLTASVQPRRQGYNFDALSRHGRIPCIGDPDALIQALQDEPAPAGDLAATLAGSCARLERAILDMAP